MPASQEIASRTTRHSTGEARTARGPPAGHRCITPVCHVPMLHDVHVDIGAVKMLVLGAETSSARRTTGRGVWGGGGCDVGKMSPEGSGRR